MSHGEHERIVWRRRAGEEQKKKAQDFIDRYQTGKPTEGYSDEEAVQHFRQAAQVATPAQMQAAFKQAVAGLPKTTARSSTRCCRSARPVKAWSISSGRVSAGDHWTRLERRR